MGEFVGAEIATRDASSDQAAVLTFCEVICEGRSA